MGKKFIVINGKKHYIKEEEGAENTGVDETEEEETQPEEEVDEGTEEAPAGADETDEENLNDEAKSIAKGIISKITAELDNLDQIKSLNAKVDKLLESTNPADSKLAQILNGKDIRGNDLTKDEKIMGFYHACMSGNVAAVKALSEGTAADGGHLVPDEFRAEIIRELKDAALVRQLARVVPMKRKTLTYPSVVSGPEVYWTEEKGTKNTTTVHFGKPQLDARKLAAILYSTDELIEDSDSVDVVNLVIQLFAERIAEKEDEAFAQGNGTTAPTGLVTAQAAGTITGPTCNGNLDFDDIIDLEFALGKQYRKNAVYLAHSTNIKELKKLKDNNGLYLWNPSKEAGTPPTLNGKPFHEFDWLPESQIYFGDFKRGYWWGDRKRISVLLSQHETTAFTKDETAIRVVERVAGNVVWGNAIKCLNTIP